jgi:alpha-galactosidase
MTFADGTIDVWAGPLANGDVAVITLNRASSQAVIPVTWSVVGLKPGSWHAVRDVWARKDIGHYNNGFTTTVEPHGVFFARIRA